MKNLKVRTKSIKKILDENIGQKLYNTGFGLNFLAIIPKAQANKQQIGFYENFKILCIRRHYQESEKATHRMGENILKSCI